VAGSGPDGRGRWWRAHAVGLAAGAGTLAVAWILLGNRRDVPQWEADAFAAVNGMGDGWKPVLLPLMQLGNFWAIPAVAVTMGIWKRDRRAVLAPLTAGLAAWGLAKLVKDLVERDRPHDLLTGVHLREDGITGLGFVSGHTAVAFALATSVAPWLPRRWRVVPFGFATVVGIARIYVGAHLPLDVVGGAGLGVVCGSIAAVVFRPRRETPTAAVNTSLTPPASPPE
jgi:undecaprenyl-diphosphatase